MPPDADVVYPTRYITVGYELYLKDGDLVLVYGILYPLGRILVETQRPDAWTIAGIPTAQWIGGFSILVCSVALWWRHRSPRQIAVTPSGGK